MKVKFLTTCFRSMIDEEIDFKKLDQNYGAF